VLPVKLPVGTYVAVIEWFPTVKLLELYEAALVVAPVAASVAEPSAVAPSENVMEPVGDPEPVGAVTDTVKVTTCPTFAGFKEDATVSVVPAEFTTSLSTADVAPAKLPVPAYATVMEFVPTGSEEVVSTAVLLCPLPGVSVTVPIAAPPFIKTTDPVGAPTLLEIVAVSVTG
jgi:hypothetical protein